SNAFAICTRGGNRFLAGCDGLVPGFCLDDELEWFTKAAGGSSNGHDQPSTGRDKLQGPSRWEREPTSASWCRSTAGHSECSTALEPCSAHQESLGSIVNVVRG